MQANEQEARYQQMENAVCREVAGEMVLLTPEDGTVHVLDEVGGLLWRLCAEPRSLTELCESITSDYNVDRETAKRDIIAFLDRLLEIGVVKKL